MKKKMLYVLTRLKNVLNQNISPRKQKIIGTVAAVPIIAASTMSGACAAGCPYGLVNDPYPGQCPRYIDVNGDGICDLSQAVAAPASTSVQSTDTQNTAPNTASNGGNDIQIGNPDSLNTTAVQDPSSGGLDGISPSTDSSNFHIIPVSLLIIMAYFFTHYLFSKGILKPKKHKRLWNLLLMGGYLGTSITGVLLIFMINFGVSLAYRQNITFWHVELAILMVICTMIHFHIYRKPFKNMFKVLFNLRSNKKKSVDTLSISK